MAVRQKILVTGASGMLGSNLAFYFRDEADVLGLYHHNPVSLCGTKTRQIDLRDENSLVQTIQEFQPDVVIHCASLTNIDYCQANQDETIQVNVIGTRNVVQALAPTTRLVYISSDSVYDGVSGDFSESDPINPLHHYGKSKYEGELAAAKHEGALILRTNLFGWNIQNRRSLAEWMLQCLQAGETIQGFKDTFFSSIYTMEFAAVLQKALRLDLAGVYNCAGSTSLSKYEFACQIAAQFGFEQSLIRPASIDDSSLKVQRGKNLTINCQKLTADLGESLPTIENSVKTFHRDYLRAVPRLLKMHDDSRSTQVPVLAYGRHSIGIEESEALAETMVSRHLTQGPRIIEFEVQLATLAGEESHAVVMNSGTAALHSACLAAGIEPGNEVITSPITFVASANCVVYCGGTPVFADIDPASYNIDPSEIKKRITERTRAIIPVHFAGQSCDMAAIQQLAKKAEAKYGHRIYIIEDACHALGSTYAGTSVGSCAFSDMAITSFHPVKHITTGEGGAVFVRDPALLKRLRRVRSHGITSEPADFQNHDLAFHVLEDGEKRPNPWYYEQVSLGFNYRITDIQCALGIAQMKKLSAFRERRQEIVNLYNKAFADWAHLKTPSEASFSDANFHLYVVLLDFEKIGRDRASFMQHLRAQGIITQVHYIPVHLQPYYQTKFGTRLGDYPQAEQYYEQCLSIPLFPAMTDEDVKRVIDEMRRAINIGEGVL